jgi:5'-nucleotidase
LRILLTNDDGYMAPGIRAIHDAFLEVGHEVTVVAPDRERSGVSLAITTTDILRAWPMKLDGMNGWIVNGNPADCVKLGASELMEQKPDIVVSGINQGTNAGLNSNYSGTVAGAVEGAMMRVPGVAVSLDSFRSQDFRAACKVAVRVLDRLGNSPETLPKMHILSINVPEGAPEAIRGVRVTPASEIVYREIIDKRTDHRGREYYWLGGTMEEVDKPNGGDHEVVGSGFATITPLKVNWTAERMIDKLREAGWEEDWPGGDA